jgi:hypothetical protein
VSEAMPSATSQESAADFVRRFEKFWRAPKEGDLGTVLAERTHLVAPMARTVDSLAEGKRAFAELFELMPDLTAAVHRWGATADGVLIEFTLSGTAGGGPISWDVVDRFVVGGERPRDRTRHLLRLDAGRPDRRPAPARLARLPAHPAATPLRVAAFAQSSRPTWRRIETESE